MSQSAVPVIRDKNPSPRADPGPRPLVELREVRRYFVDNPSFTARLIGIARTIKAVDDITMDIRAGEILGLVGETGCGKSTLAQCLAMLQPVTAGEIVFDGQVISGLRPPALKAFRQNTQVVFQDPQSSLNRSLTVADILTSPLSIHRKTRGRRQTRERMADLLGMVGLGRGFLERYPHELSGGQRQRIGIARALAVEPRFLILDEPTSSLDVSIQAQIVNLLLDLQQRFGLTYLFISHDLNLVRYACDRIGVMYLGRIIELGPAEEVWNNPRHPYTRLLVSAVPLPDPKRRNERIDVRGELPSPISPPPGCPFHPRCPEAHDRCRSQAPVLRDVAPGFSVSCHLYDGQEG